MPPGGEVTYDGDVKGGVADLGEWRVPLLDAHIEADFVPIGVTFDLLDSFA